MNSRQSKTEPVVNARAVMMLKLQLVAIIALPLLLGGLFFALGYFTGMIQFYLLASGMGLLALCSHNKQEDLRYRIKDLEQGSSAAGR